MGIPARCIKVHTSMLAIGLPCATRRCSGYILAIEAVTVYLAVPVAASTHHSDQCRLFQGVLPPWGLSVGGGDGVAN